MHNTLIILNNHITAKCIKRWSESLINGVELSLRVSLPLKQQQQLKLAYGYTTYNNFKYISHFLFLI